MALNDEAKLHLSLFSMIDPLKVYKGIEDYLKDKSFKFTVDNTWASFRFAASDE